MTNSNNQENLSPKFIQQLGTLKQMLRLSTTEAHDMRERLIAYLDLHEVPAHSGALVPSPFVFSFNLFYSRAFVAGFLIFILVLGTGTSVTYAAGNSLPGQTLYSVKVNVAEPIEGAVIAATEGTTATATWQNTLAERRLTEATTLAAENDLASSTQAYLETQAALHVAQSDDDSAELAAAGDTTGADQVRTDLEARLAAHAELLAIIAPRLAAAGDASTTSQVATLLSAVSQDQVGVLFNPDGEATTTSTTVVSSSSDTASSTSEATTTVTVAIATPSPSSISFHAQEAHFFALNAHILSLLPAASTTASTSLLENQNGKRHRNPDGTWSATSTTETITATSTDSTSDSPAGSENSDSTTTMQVSL